MVCKMQRSGLWELEAAVAHLPPVLAAAMQAGLEEPEAHIGAGAYETELAMCPVAAAVQYAEKSGENNGEWNPAWGTRADFKRRVVDFVDAFDSCAELVGLGVTLHALRVALTRNVPARTRDAGLVCAGVEIVETP